MINERVLMLSIRPKYAAMIFAGTKRVELRRVRPHISKGDRVMVYVSSPVKALSGEFVVSQVIEAKPEALWPIVEQDAGITREQFERYYEGSATAYAIFLDDPMVLSPPIELDKIRLVWHNFHPPQCYRYFSPGQVGQIVQL